MTLSKIRRQGAIFFEIISILIIAFYASPRFFDHQSNKPYQSFYQQDFKDPIIFCKVFENLNYTHSLPKLHVAEHPVWNIAVDVAALEVATSKALLVVPYLRNVFYVFVSINAP